MNLILIHIGNVAPPNYLYDNLNILSRLCVNCKKYFITNNAYINEKLNYFDFEVVPSESILRSHESIILENKISIDKEFRNGFWINTSTRFAILHDFIKSRELINNIHIENDVILYKDPANYLNYFVDFGGITFPTVIDWGIGSIVWIRNHSFSEKLISKFSENITGHDMENLGIFAKSYSDFKPLPTTPVNAQINDLNNTSFSLLNKANFIFDAAALGQYLGGIDPANCTSDTTFFINERTSLDFDKFKLQWEIIDGIRQPVMIVENIRYEIFNLHIHSKKIANFSPYNYYSSDSSLLINTFHNIYLNSDICLLNQKYKSLNLNNIYINTTFYFPSCISDTKYFTPTNDDISLIDNSYCIFIDETSILFFIKLILPRLINTHKLIFANNSDLIYNFLRELNSNINLHKIYLANSQFIGFKFKSWTPILKSLSTNLSKHHSLILNHLEKINKSSIIYCNSDYNNFQINISQSKYNLIFSSYNEDCSTDFNNHIKLLGSSKFYLFLEPHVDWTLLHQCLFFNSIPIMLKSNWNHAFSEYPVVILDNWNDLSIIDLDKIYLLYSSNFININSSFIF